MLSVPIRRMAAVPLRPATVLAATVTLFALATSTASARTSVDRLSLSQLAGQRAIFSYSGTAPPRRLYEKIRAGQVGGVILFGPNITSREQIAGVIASFQ